MTRRDPDMLFQGVALALVLQVPLSTPQFQLEVKKKPDFNLSYRWVQLMSRRFRWRTFRLVEILSVHWLNQKLSWKLNDENHKSLFVSVKKNSIIFEFTELLVKVNRWIWQRRNDFLLRNDLTRWMISISSFGEIFNEKE